MEEERDGAGQHQMNWREREKEVQSGELRVGASLSARSRDKSPAEWSNDDLGFTEDWKVLRGENGGSG